MKAGCKPHSKMLMARDRDEKGGLTRWLTGKRFFYIKIPSHPLLSQLHTGPCKATLYHYERKAARQQQSATCNRCLIPGHSASSCQSDIVCRECRKPGHKRGDPVCPLPAVPADNATQDTQYHLWTMLPRTQHHWQTTPPRMPYHLRTPPPCPSTAHDPVPWGKDYVPPLLMTQSGGKRHVSGSESAMLFFCSISLHLPPTSSQLINTTMLTLILPVQTRWCSIMLPVQFDLVDTDVGLSSLRLWVSGKQLQL